MREFGKRVVMQMLRGYKWAISPLFPPACRYVPTCSEYAMEAVERYGVLRGGWMAFARVLRCHPFAHGGYDPVVKSAQGLKPELILASDAALKRRSSTSASSALSSSTSSSTRSFIGSSTRAAAAECKASLAN